MSDNGDVDSYDDDSSSDYAVRGGQGYTPSDSEREGKIFSDSIKKVSEKATKGDFTEGWGLPEYGMAGLTILGGVAPLSYGMFKVYKAGAVDKATELMGEASEFTAENSEEITNFVQETLTSLT